MPFQTTSAKRKWLIGAGSVAALIAVGAGAMWYADDCDICEAATTILLQGTVAQNCTLSVTTDAVAANLPLTTPGAQHVQVGSALQSCNKKIGYTLNLAATNCAAAPVGAKVVDTVSTEVLAYSAEFANPTTGGSVAEVTGLLATACNAPTARDVTNFKVDSETSAIFVNFTGNALLASGTYQDTLTITITIK